MVQAMYRGETGKILLTASLFAGVFIVVKPLSVIGFFIGYGAMLLLHVLLAANMLKSTNTYFGNRP